METVAHGVKNYATLNNKKEIYYKLHIIHLYGCNMTLDAFQHDYNEGYDTKKCCKSQLPKLHNGQILLHPPGGGGAQKPDFDGTWNTSPHMQIHGHRDNMAIWLWQTRDLSQFGVLATFYILRVRYLFLQVIFCTFSVSVDLSVPVWCTVK